MTHTIFKGSQAGITLNSVACGGVTEVMISDKAAPDAAQEDTTSAPATSYTMTADPLGGKGSDSSQVVVKAFKDKVGVATGGWYKAAAVAMGTDYAVAIEPSGSVGGDQVWSHTTMQMTQRVTHLAVEEYATATYTLESADAAGTWGAHA